MSIRSFSSIVSSMVSVNGVLPVKHLLSAEGGKLGGDGYIQAVVSAKLTLNGTLYECAAGPMYCSAFHGNLFAS